MIIIETATQDLVDRVKAIPEFGGRVGLAIGGTDIDPINRDLEQPFAWVFFTNAAVIDGSKISTKFASIAYSYIIKVVIDYGSESELISTGLPVLEKTISTIKGNQINGLAMQSWSFDGMTLEDFDKDRMVWVINVSLATSL